MVILIKGSTCHTEAVVAVRHHKGNRELLDSAGNRRLQHADIGHVMGRQRIKTEAEAVLLTGGVVLLQNGISDGPPPGGGPIQTSRKALLLRETFSAVQEEDAAVGFLNHGNASLYGWSTASFYRSMDTPGRCSRNVVSSFCPSAD